MTEIRKNVVWKWIHVAPPPLTYQQFSKSYIFKTIDQRIMTEIRKICEYHLEFERLFLVFIHVGCTKNWNIASTNTFTIKNQFCIYKKIHLCNLVLINVFFFAGISNLCILHWHYHFAIYILIETIWNYENIISY